MSPARATDLLARVAGTAREARVLEVAVPDHRPARRTRGGPRPGRRFARLHGSEALRRLAAPLDAELPELRHRSPVAEAAPAAPAAEPPAVNAAVEELRTLALAGAARRFIALVPPDRLEDAEPLFAEALAAGADFELELIPGSDVAAVRRPGWILVPAA